MNIDNYLDHRNRAIYDRVATKYSISLQSSQDNTYGVFTQGNNAIIFIPDFANNNEEDYSGFTHELLHLYFDLQGYLITNTLLYDFSNNPVLSQAYERELVEHIGNCLVHNKMLPMYIKLGFDRKSFIADYNERKSDDQRISLIGYLFETGKYWRAGVIDFISVFFAIKSCPNERFDYKEDLSKLEQLQKELFQILNKFWINNLNYDPMLKEVTNTYRRFTQEFVDELIEWTNKQRPDSSLS